MMLKRKIYDELVAWAGCPYRAVPLVAGARQIGKTFIIRKFLEETYENVVELNFVTHPQLCSIFDNDLDVDTLITEISVRVPGARLVPGKTAIFLDEIQECPNAKTACKPFVEDGRFRVIASGSLLGIRLKKPRSNPVGFLDEIRMYPMDFEEFLWAIGLDDETVSKIRRNISEKKSYSETVLETLDRYFSLYMIVGGMPEVVCEYVASKDIQAVRAIQKKLITGYRGDIAKYAEKSDIDKVNACFDSIPVQLSREYKKFSYVLIESKDDPNLRTYERSLQWMRDASLVNTSYNLSAPTEPIEENVIRKQFKIYMGDTGLLTYMLGLNVAKSILSGDTRVNHGAVMENIVGQCLVSGGMALKYYMKTYELDFITVFGGCVAVVEVKSGDNNKAKSLKYAKKTFKIGRLIKLEKCNIYVDDDGIEHYPLFAAGFLKEMFRDPEVRMDYSVDDLVKALDEGR